MLPTAALLIKAMRSLGEPLEAPPAIFSTCGTYRYYLARRWSGGSRTLAFVMLNPSTADAELDDPTIRRCRSFARAADYDALAVVNLFAFRATDPTELRGDESVGAENDGWICRVTTESAAVLVAWGSHGDRWSQRAKHVVRLIQRPMLCLGTTRTGQPRHPLLVPASRVLVPWVPRAAPER